MRPIQGDVELYVIMHPRLTAKGVASKTRLDLDGCLKATCDALNGVLYADDKQITRLVAEVGEPIKDGAISVQVRAMAITGG
jgi:crossover junction endodeoxyribonuclease RusA